MSSGFPNRDGGQLQEFFEQHCAGVEYDRCNGDTCEYGSECGCTHPLFPIEAMKEYEMSKMSEGDVIYTHTDGRTFIVDRPWWMSHASYAGYNRTGKIVVARCNAKLINPPKKMRGMMLGLSEEELAQFPLSVGVMETAWSIVDGERPKSNSLDNVLTREQTDHYYEMLQTEGEGYDEEIEDRTPYQKGDAGDPLYEEQ